MKIRISATIDEATDKMLDRILKSKKYRNKSHIIEDAILNLGIKENAK